MENTAGIPKRNSGKVPRKPGSQPRTKVDTACRPAASRVEITTPESWVGKTVAEMSIRSRYNVNILGVRMGDEIEPVLNPQYRFSKGTHLLVAGDKEAGARLMGELD